MARLLNRALVFDWHVEDESKSKHHKDTSFKEQRPSSNINNYWTLDKKLSIGRRHTVCMYPIEKFNKHVHTSDNRKWIKQQRSDSQSGFCECFIVYLLNATRGLLCESNRSKLENMKTQTKQTKTKQRPHTLCPKISPYTDIMAHTAACSLKIMHQTCHLMAWKCAREMNEWPKRPFLPIYCITH